MNFKQRIINSAMKQFVKEEGRVLYYRKDGKVAYFLIHERKVYSYRRMKKVCTRAYKKVNRKVSYDNKK